MAEDKAVTPLDMLMAVIGILLPDRVRRPGRRRIVMTDEQELREAELETAVAALSDPRADPQVDGQVIVALLRAIDRLTCNGADVDALLVQVVAHVERRWANLVLSLADIAVTTYDRSRIFSTSPGCNASLS